MLRIYPVLLELVRFVRPLVKELERHDPDLARQCRSALCSAPLNVAEGSYSRGAIARPLPHCSWFASRGACLLRGRRGARISSGCRARAQKALRRSLGTLVRLTSNR